MNYLMPAQASAQLLSLVVFAAIARWYVSPWLNSRARADALIALLWVHVFRYVALQVFSAQQTGFPISDGGAMEIVVGDVAGAVIAFVTIALLRRRARFAILLAWFRQRRHLVRSGLLCADGGRERRAHRLAALLETERGARFRSRARLEQTRSRHPESLVQRFLGFESYPRA